MYTCFETSFSVGFHFYFTFYLNNWKYTHITYHGKLDEEISKCTFITYKENYENFFILHGTYKIYLIYLIILESRTYLKRKLQDIKPSMMSIQSLLVL